MTTSHAEVAADGDLVRVVLSGEIDLSNAEEIERTISGAISNQAAAVSVDLSAVEYLDSAGLRLLFGLARRLEVLQISLELIAPVDSPARFVLELTGVTALAQLTPPPASAP